MQACTVPLTLSAPRALANVGKIELQNDLHIPHIAAAAAAFAENSTHGI